MAKGKALNLLYKIATIFLPERIYAAKLQVYIIE